MKADHDGMRLSEPLIEPEGCLPVTRTASIDLATPDPHTRVRYTKAKLLKDQTPRKLRTILQAEEDPGLGDWLAALGTSLPLFLLSYSSCVSYAQLIVSGSPVSATIVTAMHLVSSGLTGLILPLRSQCPLIVPSADITVTLFYQCVVQDVVRSAAAEGALTDTQVAATALLALPVNTVLMSLAFWWVGQKKATVAVSYLPYPVVAGFLGSIGWAIFAGSFSVLSDHKVNVPMQIPDLACERPAELACALAMVFSAGLLRACNVSARVVAVAPMLTALIGFWICALLSAAPEDDLRSHGWLFPLTGNQPFWSVWEAQHLAEVQWNLLPPRICTFLGLGMVLVLSLTLRIAGIEGSTGVGLDVDEEVKWTGIASASAGLCGTVIGSHSPGLTTFNQEAGSTDVRVALITAGLQLGLWLSGVPAMNYFPRFLLSGILMNLGFMMLLEWMWKARHKVGIGGLLVIYAQVVSSAVFGLLPSVLVGVAVACANNQAQLMTLHVLKFHVSGDSISSNMQRTAAETAYLKQHMNKVEVVGLEGHLGEGPMIKFATYVRKYMKVKDHVRFMLFDFRFCQGTNPSACAILAKLDRVLQEKGILAIYTNVSAAMLGMLACFGVPDSKLYTTESAGNPSFIIGLRYCEDKILETMSHRNRQMASPRANEATLNEALAGFLCCSAGQAEKLASCGQWATFDAGAVLSVQGRVAEKLHIVAPGHGEVTEEVDVGQSQQTMHQLSVSPLGWLSGAEGVLYEERARTNVRVSAQRSRVLVVQKEAMRLLAEQDPSLHACVARAANLQLLRRSDALTQAVELLKGGGWGGATFDRVTAEVTASLTEEENEIRQLSSSPNGVSRRGCSRSLQRKTTIANSAAEWLARRRERPGR